MIISVYNVKGGTKKTTASLNLSSLLNPHYIVDLDQHESITTFNKMRKDAPPFEVVSFESKRKFAEFLLSNRETKSVIIDCGGFDSDFNAVAISASHLVIIPTTESPQDIRGLMHTVEAINRENVTANVWIVPVGVHHNKKNFPKLESITKEMAGVSLRKDLRIRALEEVNEAFWKGKGINEVNKYCSAARDYKNLASEIMKDGRS